MKTVINSHVHNFIHRKVANLKIYVGQKHKNVAVECITKQTFVTTCTILKVHYY